MRVAGRLAAELLDYLTPHVQPGITTGELDRIAHDYQVNVQDVIPATLNYAPPGHPPYPASICTSVNHVVCHGIPGDKKLKPGDIVNIDVTVIKDGWHGDTSRMFYVGTPSIQARRLVETTYEAMWRGIRAVRAGAQLGDIGYTIQKFAESHDFSIVREFCGHGIGAQFHEEPQVLHYGRPGTGPAARRGHDLHDRADDQRRPRRDPQPRRRLDDRHRGPFAVRAVGAHGAGDADGYEVLTVSAGTPPPPPELRFARHGVPRDGIRCLDSHARRPAARRHRAAVARRARHRPRVAAGGVPRASRHAPAAA